MKKNFNKFILITSLLILYIGILKPYSIYSDQYQIDFEFEEVSIKPFDYELYNDATYHLETGNFVSLGDVSGPETMIFSKSGDRLYFALKNGQIRYLETPLNVITKEELLKNQDKYNGITRYLCTVGRPLGLTVDNQDNLIIADALKGLLKYDVKRNELITLTSSVNDKKLTFINDAHVAKDDIIYFSNSMKLAPFLDKNGDYNTHIPSFFAILGMTRSGQLLSYNPKTKETKILMDNLGYANGVTIDTNEESIFVAECATFRVHRYWIKGKNQGKHEIFIDNLPGYPDGINVANNKLYISIFSNRTPVSDIIYPFGFLKKLILRIPYIRFPKSKPSLVVADVDTGKVLDYYSAAPNSIQDTLTSTIEKDGKIYMGNLLSNYFVIINDKTK